MGSGRLSQHVQGEDRIQLIYYSQYEGSGQSAVVIAPYDQPPAEQKNALQAAGIAAEHLEDGAASLEWEALEGGRSILPPPWGTSWPSCSPGWAGAGPLRRAGQLLPGGEPGGSGGAGALRPQRPLRRGLSPQPPSPPRGQGVYTLEGFLPPEREAGYRTRMAAETRPVIGVLIHDTTPEPAIWSMWTPCCGPFRPGGASHTPVRLLRRRPRDGAGHPLPDGRFYRRADGTPIPGALVVSYGFSLTTLAGREARAGQVPASVFENWACR